jgi:hypothetical protein
VDISKILAKRSMRLISVKKESKYRSRIEMKEIDELA